MQPERSEIKEKGRSEMKGEKKKEMLVNAYKEDKKSKIEGIEKEERRVRRIKTKN